MKNKPKNTLYAGAILLTGLVGAEAYAAPNCKKTIDGVVCRLPEKRKTLTLQKGGIQDSEVKYCEIKVENDNGTHISYTALGDLGNCENKVTSYIKGKYNDNSATKPVSITGNEAHFAKDIEPKFRTLLAIIKNELKKMRRR